MNSLGRVGRVIETHQFSNRLWWVSEASTHPTHDIRINHPRRIFDPLK